MKPTTRCTIAPMLFCLASCLLLSVAPGCADRAGRDLDRRAKELYEPVAESYDARKWEEVQTAYAGMTKAISADEQGDAIRKTVHMAKATVMVRLADCYVAVAKKDRDWFAAALKAANECRKARELAESEHANTMESKAANEFGKWLDEIHVDLREFEDEYLATRTFDELKNKVNEARKSRQYLIALTLLSPETLKEMRLRLTSEQKLEIIGLRTRIRREEFMHTFEAMHAGAEELYKGGKGNPAQARPAFERAAAAMGTDRARLLVPKSQRDKIVAQLKARIAAIDKAMTEKSADLPTRVRKAVSAYRNGKWKEAIPLLKGLMAYSSTATGIERAQLRAWLKECDLRIIIDSRYEQQMTQGRARIKAKDYKGALAYFEVAYGIKKTDEAKKLIAEMRAKIKEMK